jgi:PD-(D/E)XK nuclease superfamily domain
MAGGAKAVSSGDDLAKQVCELGKKLGLEVREQFKVARRVWGAERKIDVILKDPKTTKTLGIECKYQGGGGSAEEKVPATIQDIEAWPIDGIVVFAGEGFTENMKSFLISTGKAIHLEDVEPWLRLYFGLPLDSR